MDEDKLKQLPTIEENNHNKEQRASMILQGVNWLTLIQGILILFIYQIPLAITSMLKTLSHTKENK